MSRLNKPTRPGRTKTHTHTPAVRQNAARDRLAPAFPTCAAVARASCEIMSLPIKNVHGKTDLFLWFVVIKKQREMTC